MRYCKPNLTLICAVLFAVGLSWGSNAAADEPALTGEWTLSIDSPRGTRHPKLVVVAEDDNLSGTYHSARGPIPIEEIRFDGSEFSFPLQLKVPIGRIEVTYSGSILGDEMQGVVQSPRGEVRFTGERSD